VLLDGEDVTDAIRQPEVGDFASAVSVHTPVRRVLAAQQIQIVAGGGYTLEGRDTTTVIAPEAEVKVFLTASIEERARRRHSELREKGMGVSLEEIRAQIEERDRRDSTRADSPLRIADGAHVIESDGMSIDQVVEKIKSIARAAQS
jgi:CMP/dCMP kinase